MTHITTIATLRQAALNAIATTRSLCPDDQLASLWTTLRRKEVADCLAILNRDAAALPDPAEREAARRAAEEVRDALGAPHPSASPLNSGSE
ncbi:hypothetical protein ACFQY5_39605 [Paeniroseomonas aquatica]|uniref:Uncharacterized protein n=1 Tax=Paeniroseomonas aquatica TaxID=373043 RepID=A0ABT8A1F0_9PROT|nr:hypothetical protein [Paeniroseomonas aquatica]MDN3563532.1 hypothetical protein [Paeniroseomonas aquatica]